MLKIFDIKQILSFDKFKTYEGFLEDEKIKKNPNLFWCPTPNCNQIIEIKNQKSHCMKCLKDFCIKCKNPSHEDECQKQEMDFFA